MTWIRAALILLLITVLTSAARILLKHEDKVIEEERELQEEMPEESFLFRKRSSETGGHGHDIDNPNVDPNSKLENILESQKVFVGGTIKKATGLHEKDKEFEKEENNEEVIGENNNGNNGKGETKGKKRQEEEKREEKEEEEEKGEERERTKNKNRLTERNFPADYTFANGRLWPNGVVPYAVDETSYSTEISSFNSLLGQTIELFDRETCISFKPKTDSLLQSLGHQNFVTFYNGSGCSSPVGVSSGKISINYPGCTYVGTFFHEMCHTIGMMHEQSRKDRNLQMLVKWANIKNGKQGNFVKSNTKTHDNVDLHSVMQYSLWSFSKNNEQTITLKNDDYQFLVNSNRNYSFYDIADINYVYQCSDSCTTKPACKYYGFVNKDCKCRCPDGLKGDLCNEIDGNCGGFIDLTSGSSQNITSSNWPNQHNVNDTCVWVITAPADHRVKVKILEMDLAYTASPNLRCYHWLALHGNLIGEPGLKRCGTLSSNEKSEYFHVINTESNLMMIKFDSLYANDKPPAKGFKLEATAFKSGCLKRPCKMGGTCVEGNNDFTYTCVCPPGYSGVNCTDVKANASVTCNFEIDFGDHCFLRNVQNWKIHYEMDNVPANDSGVYAYVSWPGNPSKMVSDVNFEATDRCLVFDYYNTGTLKVFYESSDFSGRREALATGTTSEWTKANVHFPNVNGLKITFEGEYGDGNLKAVDNVVIVPGVCGVPCTLSNPCLNGGVCVVSADQTSFTCNCVNGFTGQLCDAPSNLTSFTCSSEPENSCFLTDADNDDQNWKVQTLQTPSSGTGPSSAFQGNYYRYLEASYVEPGKKAILINSMRDLPETKRCLIFYYHMYGSTMGTLNIKTQQDGSEVTTTVWSRSGDQGNAWHKAAIDLQSAPRFNMEIEAIVGSDFSSDIAIDSVTLRPGVCGCDSDPCLNGATCQNSGETITCSCAAGFFGTICDQIGDATIYAKFEDGTLGFLNHDGDGQNMWAINQVGTPSSETGPSAAYEGVKYVYFEASIDFAQDSLISVDILPNIQRCLEFAYNMYGATMGTLNVKTFNLNDNSNSTIWTKTGDQGQFWKATAINIPAVANNYKIIFEGVKGYSWQSDMAVDNITLRPRVCGCASNPCMNGGACSENADYSYTCQCTSGYSGNLCQIIGNKEVSATFEDSTLGFLQQDDNGQSIWLIRQGGTPSNNTGPTAAIEGMKYVYFEASHGTLDSLISTDVFTNTVRCLKFSYHMYGQRMGTLNIKTLDVAANTQSTKWSVSGDQGTSWKTKAVELSSIPGNYKIIFEAVRGIDFQSDIAVDNITLSPRTCGCDSNPCLNGGACTENADLTYTCQCTSGYAGTLCNTIDDAVQECTYETGSNCFLSQATDDNSDWVINEGGTSSSNTGPGAAQSGTKYIYTEASFRNPDEIDRLVTTNKFTNRVRCLRFYYHMYGSYMGTLRILVNNTQNVFQKSGNQGNSWLFAEVDIPAVNDLKITIEGVRGPSWSSDIALDNVKLEANSCGSSSKKRELSLVKKLIKELEEINGN